ncbi:hypothetical protein QL285_014760 [Trifolium repens]|nr:hypothetical protein QL285_014760 [Trifolium repens]
MLFYYVSFERSQLQFELDYFVIMTMLRCNFCLCCCFYATPPIQTTTSEAFRFIPTPGFTLSRQFQQGPPQHTTHDMERDHRHQDDEQEHEEENQEVDEEGEIEKDGEEDNHDKDTCGKVIIRPICNGFTPADVAAAAIRRVIEKTFPDNITCYSEVKDKAREVWFERFRKPEWMNEVGWKYLTDRWKEDDFKTRSERMKINRASSKGGALHTTGRKAHHDIALDMCTSGVKAAFHSSQESLLNSKFSISI